MTKLVLQNYFTTSLLNEVDNGITGEKEFQLSQAPTSEFGFLIVDYANEAKREEIFYHRKAGNSVFTYGVNRTGPQSHSAGASVQLNDSANVFNHLVSLTPNHFFMYKTSNSTMYVKGGKIFDNGVYKTIPDKTNLTFVQGTNYLYVDEGVIATTTDTITNKLVFGEVVMNGSAVITSFENYNTMAIITERTNQILKGSGAPGAGTGINGDFYFDDVNKVMYGPKFNGTEWGDPTSLQGEQGPQGIQGIQGIPGTIAAAPAETQQTVADNITISGGGVVTKSVGNWIRITYPDTSYEEYTTTTIKYFDANGDLAYQEAVTGAWVGDIIEYSIGSINSINGNTGTLEITGEIAYRNQVNTFTEKNNFTNTTEFSGQHVFTPYTNAAETTTINAANGTKQVVSWNQSRTLNMTNLVNGTTLLLAVNLSVASATLTLGTFTNLDGVKTYTKYSIGDQTHPYNITQGTNLFVFEVFSDGIHISYSGHSGAIV